MCLWERCTSNFCSCFQRLTSEQKCAGQHAQHTFVQKLSVENMNESLMNTVPKDAYIKLLFMYSPACLLPCSQGVLRARGAEKGRNKNRRASSPVRKGFYAHEERETGQKKIGEHPPLFARGFTLTRSGKRDKTKSASIFPCSQGGVLRARGAEKRRKKWPAFPLFSRGNWLDTLVFSGARVASWSGQASSAMMPVGLPSSARRRFLSNDARRPSAYYCQYLLPSGVLGGFLAASFGTRGRGYLSSS
jgi:hypothetical protein